jgi:hypothetical protein
VLDDTVFVFHGFGYFVDCVNVHEIGVRCENVLQILYSLYYTEIDAVNVTVIVRFFHVKQQKCPLCARDVFACLERLQYSVAITAGKE